jgi:hypothetical protein
MTGFQILQFSNAVFAAYNDADFGDLLLGLNKPPFAKLVAGAIGFKQQVEVVVAIANSQGWIEQLVLAVIKDRGHTQVIKQFLLENPDWDPAKNPPVVDPSDAFTLLGGRYFIGRPELRRFLKRMNVTTDRKVLAITSDHRKVGKTYSRDLINFIADHGKAGVVYEDLDAADFNPVTLAKKLGAAMNRDLSGVSDQPSQQAPRSNQELVSLLIPTPNEAAAKVWWIILDGFRRKLPSEALKDFIERLATQIVDRPDFRLLLINYTYELPIDVDYLVLKEKVEPLCPDELKQFLINIYETRKGMAPSQEKLDQYLKSIEVQHKAIMEKRSESAQDQLLLNIAVTQVVEEWYKE